LSSTPPPEPASLPRPLPGFAGRLALGLVEALPLLLPALFAGFSLVAMVLLHLGLYRPALVLPLGLIGAAAAGLGVGLVRSEPLAGNRFLDGAAVLVTLGFAALNVRYSAQNISVFRDPAAYAVTGQWLVHHGSLPIPVNTEVFGTVPGVRFHSAAFDPGPDAGFVYPQYGNLLPGLLAVGGWLYSDGLLLKLNPLIGSAALLGFYGLVRQYTARSWALVAMIVLGVSLPQLHFSRNTYSEPVTMLFLVGGLALLREAQRRGSTRGYGLAGLVLGSAALARIDGLYFLLTVPLLAAATLAIASPERRRDATRKVAALLLGVAVPAVVAMANLIDLSPVYLHNLGSELIMVATAMAAVTVVGGVAVFLAWRTRLMHRLASATRGWLPGVGAAAVVLLAAVAASRPLWYVGRTPDVRQSQIHYITFLQKANGLPLDGTRSYAEQTLLWFSWYYGPITVALGVLGVAFGVHRLLRRGDLRLLAPLTMFLSAALLYVTVPSIVPDQIWAMRRYLSVVIPGLLLAAAVVLGLLARRSRAGMTASVLLAGIMILIPAMLSSRLVTVRDLVPQLPEVLNLCDNLPVDAAVLVTGSLAETYPQTVRSYCQVPVAKDRQQPTRAQLKQVQAAAQAHHRRLYLLFTDSDEVPGDTGSGGAAWQQISCVLISHWNATLNKAVANHGVDKRMLYLGEITPEGMVTPAPLSRPPLWAC
jgi:4-amino-4-deoxy-L-arabinose transferase-like glycosyltransferase